MAVRLQMKLGVVAEHDRLADSPDTLVVVEPSVGSVARSKGHLYLLVTSRVGHAPRSRGDAPGRRDDPQRVLLRRVGRHPGVPPEGDRDRQQAARPPGRPARSQVARRQRADRRRGRRRPRQRDVRGDGRTGRGVPHSPGTPLDAARPPSGARPARRRRSSPTCGAARSRSATRSSWSRRTSSPSSAPTSSRTRCSRSTRSRRWSTSTTGSWRPTARAATARSRSRRPRSPRPRKGRTLVPVRPAEPLAGAPDRSPIPLADNVQAAGVPSRPRPVLPGSRRAAPSSGRSPGSRSCMPRRKPAYRRVTPLVVAARDPASGGVGRPRPRHRGRRPRARRLRLRRQRAAAGDQLGQRRSGGARFGPGGPRPRSRAGDRPRRRRPEARRSTC